MIERIVPLINSSGVHALATTEDEEALASLASGKISTLVIGGEVEQPSRDRLQRAAEQYGVRVLEGHARGKDPEAYVRHELLPALEPKERGQ
jgi:hypothetical protein